MNTTRNIFGSLRHASLMRWVLVVFVLALGTAIASPLIKPTKLELLCSGSGMSRLIVLDDQGQAVEQAHTLDCALCVQASAPPPPVFAHDFTSPLAHAARHIEAARIAVLTQPPLPARGPPAA